MIKAVIFDMDGLLIDSEPLWDEAEIKVFSQLGANLTKSMRKDTRGLRINEIIDFEFNRFSLKEPSKAKVQERLTNEIISLIKSKGQILAGAEEIVRMFSGANIPMAIASSSSMSIIDAVLEIIPIREYMKVVYSAEFEEYGKPHPGVWITTAKKLGVLPTECLTFEDSPNGALSAKAAKMKCVAVPNADIKGDRRFVIADMVIDSLLDFKLKDLNKFRSDGC